MESRSQIRLYGPDNIPVTKAWIEKIGDSQAKARDMRSLLHIYKTGGKLVWLAKTHGSAAIVYPAIVDKDGSVLTPGPKVTKEGKLRFQSISICLPPLPVQEGDIDPGKALYKFKSTAAPKFSNYMKLMCSTDDGFDQGVFGEADEAMKKFSKFLDKDLLEFLCNGKCVDGKAFQRYMFPTLFTSPKINENLKELANHLRDMYDDVTNDVWIHRCRDSMINGALRHNLLDVDWSRFNSANKTKSLRQNEIDYIDTWKKIAATLPYDRASKIYTALEAMEEEIIKNIDETRPLTVHKLGVLDASRPPKIIPDEDIVKYVRFPRAIVGVEVLLGPFRADKKWVTDLNVTDVQIFLNGPETACNGVTMDDDVYGDIEPEINIERTKEEDKTESAEAEVEPKKESVVKVEPKVEVKVEPKTESMETDEQVDAGGAAEDESDNEDSPKRSSPPPQNQKGKRMRVTHDDDA